MKGVIVYKGKYGTTSQYAAWLSDELQLPVFIPGSLSTGELLECDFVVIGSPVYMGKLLINDWLRQHTSILQNKKIFMFVVTATPASEEAKREKVLKENIPVPLRNRCDVYFLPGRLMLKALSPRDRALVWIASLFEKDPANKHILKHGFDILKPEYLADLVKAVHIYNEREDTINTARTIISQ